MPPKECVTASVLASLQSPPNFAFASTLCLPPLATALAPRPLVSQFDSSQLTFRVSQNKGQRTNKLSFRIRGYHYHRTLIYNGLFSYTMSACVALDKQGPSCGKTTDSHGSGFLLQFRLGSFGGSVDLDKHLAVCPRVQGEVVQRVVATGTRAVEHVFVDVTIFPTQ